MGLHWTKGRKIQISENSCDCNPHLLASHHLNFSSCFAVKYRCRLQCKAGQLPTAVWSARKDVTCVCNCCLLLNYWLWRCTEIWDLLKPLSGIMSSLALDLYNWIVCPSVWNFTHSVAMTNGIRVNECLKNASEAHDECVVSTCSACTETRRRIMKTWNWYIP